MALDVDSLKTHSHPLRKGARGYYAMATGPDAVPEIIEQVLNTVPGERVMRPTFGCDIHRHVFAPADQREAETAKADILQALKLWVPYITVDGGVRGIEVTIDGHAVTYSVRYRIGGVVQEPADGEIELRRK
jgi:phage baseplate assembly protein W